jgi:hypothetical protein
LFVLKIENALEIIFLSLARIFPWILNAFDLHAYELLKIIELFVRHDETLPRCVIKHLNSIEKRILESYAWKTESPLWNVLREAGNHVPVFDEVFAIDTKYQTRI